MIPIIRLIRPDQWIKNGFVFLPMFFGGTIGSQLCWKEAFFAFVCFSLISSAVYCLNDIRDVEYDKIHPIKCHRPIASGALSRFSAVVTMIILIILSYSVVLLFTNGVQAYAFIVISCYVALNLGYSFGLKNYAIIDVFILAMGFVLRVVLGGVVCLIELSPWIICMTFLITLFLAFAKRRDDVIISINTGKEVRRSSTRYNVEYLNMILCLLGAVTIVCYVIYSVNPDVILRLGSKYVYVTSIFVLAGILKYLQIAIVDNKSGSPTKIALHDRFIQLCVTGWVLTFVMLLYV